MIGRRRVRRNQVRNIAEIPIVIVTITPVMMTLHRAHPRALPRLAHLVMIAGLERSIARGVNEIGAMISISTVAITIEKTALATVLTLLCG